MLSKKARIIVAVLIMIGAVIYTVPSWEETKDVVTGNIPSLTDYLEEYGDGELPERYVSVTIDANLGNYASVTYDDTSGKDRYYYIAWLDDSSFISMYVFDSNRKLMDKISDKTWSYLDGDIDSNELLSGDVYSFVGIIRSMDDEEERFYRSTIAEYGIDESESVVRYQAICPAGQDLVSSFLIDKYLMPGIIILLALYDIIKNGSKLLKERRQRKAFENSISSYGTSIASSYEKQKPVKKAKVVTGKDAVKRVNNESLKLYLKKKKRLALAGSIILALSILAPVIYSIYSHNEEVSAKNTAVYNMDDAAEYEKASVKSIGEIKVSYVPILFYSPSSGDYGVYMISTDNGIYIAELDDKEYQKAMKELKDTGVATLHGYYDTLLDMGKENAVTFYNESTGEDIDLDDYDELFGKYCLVVEESYNGSGISEDDIETAVIFAMFPCILGLFLLYFGMTPVHSFKKTMCRLNDSEYAMLESDLKSATTKEIIKNAFYCTNKYIFTYYTDTRLIPYSDIVWAYVKINKQYGKDITYTIEILDIYKGSYSLPALAACEANMDLANFVLNLIAQKNPKARIGYTKENIDAAS